MCKCVHTWLCRCVVSENVYLSKQYTRYVAADPIFVVTHWHDSLYWNYIFICIYFKAFWMVRLFLVYWQVSIYPSLSVHLCTTIDTILYIEIVYVFESFLNGTSVFIVFWHVSMCRSLSTAILCLCLCTTCLLPHCCPQHCCVTFV